MKKFVIRPDLDLYEGVIVTNETKLEYKSSQVEQKLEKLELRSIIKSKDTGNGTNVFESTTHLTIYLKDNDILLFEEGRGYYLPSIPVSTIDDAIEDIKALKNFDKE